MDFTVPVLLLQCRSILYLHPMNVLSIWCFCRELLLLLRFLLVGRKGDTLALFLFIICLDYVLRTSVDKLKENGFELTKKRSRRYPAKKNYWRQLRWWHSVTGEYTKPSLNTTTEFGTSHRRHWRPCQCTQNWIYVLQRNRRYFHTRRNLSETSRQIYLPRKQRIINRRRHRHTTNENMDSYR